MAAFTIGLLGPWLYRAPMAKLAFYTRHEIVRRGSPDEMEDAVLIEVRPPRYLPNQVSYEIYIWKHGATNGVTLPVLTATNAGTLNLRWIAPHLLEIGYRHARIDQFVGHWAPCPGCKRTVEIHLALY